MKNGQVRHQLGNRQLEIMDLIINEELSPEQIATKLSVHIGTVRWHTAKIMELYDTNSMTTAIIRYMKEKYTVETTE